MADAAPRLRLHAGVPALRLALRGDATNHGRRRGERRAAGPLRAWRLRTAVDNVEDVEESGDYAFVKTAGPAHLSLADRGITFATNADQGLCVRFVDRVRVDLPLGHLRCPAATLTVADPAALRADLLD